MEYKVNNIFEAIKNFNFMYEDDFFLFLTVEENRKYMILTGIIITYIY